jgi:hypothetical protein
MKDLTMLFAGVLPLVWFSSCVEVRHLGGSCDVTSEGAGAALEHASRSTTLPLPLNEV